MISSLLRLKARAAEVTYVQAQPIYCFCSLDVVEYDIFMSKQDDPSKAKTPVSQDA